MDKAILPFYTTLEEEERSGMGFTIMQTFMDGFTLSSEKGKGTVVTMFKRIGNGEYDQFATPEKSDVAKGRAHA